LNRTEYNLNYNIFFLIFPKFGFPDPEIISFLKIRFLVIFITLKGPPILKKMATVVSILIYLIDYYLPILSLPERISNLRIILIVIFLLDTGLSGNSNDWLTEFYLDKFDKDWNILSVIILSEIIIFIKSRYIPYSLHIFWFSTPYIDALHNPQNLTTIVICDRFVKMEEVRNVK
jgi:hypothetical protein